MSQNRQRWILVAIALMFLAPVIVAMLMQSGWWDYHPGQLRNAGILLQPPVPASVELSDSGQNPSSSDDWSLLYPIPVSCLQDCQRDVTNLRQVHIATGRHVNNLRLVLLRPGTFPPSLAQQLESIYSQFLLIPHGGDALTTALQEARVRAIQQTQRPVPGSSEGWTFLMDPVGNIILAYPPPQYPNDIKKDLKRLLTYSK